MSFFAIVAVIVNVNNMIYFYTLITIIAITNQLQIVLLYYKHGYTKEMVYVQIANTIILSWSIYKLIN